MFVYTFPKYRFELQRVEQMTKEECEELLNSQEIDGLPLGEFEKHHNWGMINLDDYYLKIT